MHAYLASYLKKKVESEWLVRIGEGVVRKASTRNIQIHTHIYRERYRDRDR